MQVAQGYLELSIENLPGAYLDGATPFSWKVSLRITSHTVMYLVLIVHFYRVYCCGTILFVYIREVAWGVGVQSFTSQSRYSQRDDLFQG